MALLLLHCHAGKLSDHRVHRREGRIGTGRRARSSRGTGCRVSRSAVLVVVGGGRRRSSGSAVASVCRGSSAILRRATIGRPIAGLSTVLLLRGRSPAAVAVLAVPASLLVALLTIRPATAIATATTAATIGAALLESLLALVAVALGLCLVPSALAIALGVRVGLEVATHVAAAEALLLSVSPSLAVPACTAVRALPVVASAAVVVGRIVIIEAGEPVGDFLKRLTQMNHR